MDELKKLFKKLVNRETISYVFFGVLTTVVSLVSYKLCTLAFIRFTGEKHVMASTVLSWIFAVSFAYVTNKIFVFGSKTRDLASVTKELAAFFSARLLSLGYELVWMYVTVKVLKWDDFICKIIAQFVIVVLNYIFSKLFIFKNGGQKSE